MAELALLVASRLRRQQFTNAVVLANWNTFGKYIELIVIGGFGVLSLWHAFSDEASLYVSIIITGIILSLTFYLFRKHLSHTQLREAQTAIESK